jgi:hypothetical protein
MLYSLCYIPVVILFKSLRNSDLPGIVKLNFIILFRLEFYEKALNCHWEEDQTSQAEMACLATKQPAED